MNPKGSNVKIAHELQDAAAYIRRADLPVRPINPSKARGDAMSRRADALGYADRIFARVVQEPHIGSIERHVTKLLDSAEIRSILPDKDQQNTFIERMSSQAEHLLGQQPKKLANARTAINALRQELLGQ